MEQVTEKDPKTMSIRLLDLKYKVKLHYYSFRSPNKNCINYMKTIETQSCGA